MILTEYMEENRIKVLQILVNEMLERKGKYGI